MNSSYRLIWSLARQAWVAAPETATGRRKGAPRPAGLKARCPSLAPQLRPQAAGLSPLAAALFLVFAGGAPHDARAATYTASTQAELVTAINLANADGDPSSTIKLGANLLITNPALLPVVTKALAIAPGAFTLSTAVNGNFNTAAGVALTINTRVASSGALTKDGAGTAVLGAAGSTVANDIRVTAGALRVEGGGQVNFGNAVSGGLNLDGNNTSVTVTGAGSRMNAGLGTSAIGSAAGSTLNIENSGEFLGATVNMATAAGTTGTVNVTGANSRLAVTGGVSLTRGAGAVTVTDGGKIQSAIVGIGGTGGVPQGGTGTVLVSGAGSRWDSTNLFHMHRGALSILDGGVVSATAVNLAAFSGTASTTLVSGAGSELVATAGPIALGLSGNGTLTIANGGKVTINGGAGLLTVATGAAGRGTLSIGGAKGQAAAAAGALNAALVQFGTGTAGLVNFNHTDAAYAFNPAIAGRGSVAQEGPGTTILGGASTYTGTTTVNSGTLRAGGVNRFSASSAHTVGAGGTLDLAGFSHTLASLNNSGAVSLAGAAPGASLTVNGAYVGHGAILRMSPALGTSNNVTDQLVLNGAGASAGGNTSIQVARLDGLGAQTRGSGIEVVAARGGATTAASAFTLAGGHVDAGVFEYTLHRGSADQSWYLRSELGAAASAVPSYRAEVPLLAALPAQVRLADTAMLGNRNLRGEGAPLAAAEDAPMARNGWGRLISTDVDVAQPGLVSPTSSGRFNGFQAGTDLYAGANLRAGVYAGALDGSMQVGGFARGVQGPVGSNKLRARYLGAYAAWDAGTGFYADAVLQAGRQDYTLQPQGNAPVPAKSGSLLASVELGQAFDAGNGWAIEPQLQLIHQRLKFDDLALSGAGVQQDSPGSLTLRIGVRVKTDMSTGLGTFRPYARVNLYRASGGLDTARFSTPGSRSDVTTRTGGSWGELAAGMALAIDKTWSVYGEFGRLFDNGGDVSVRSDVSASVGVLGRW